MSLNVVADSASELFRRAAQLVLDRGIDVSPRGQATKEVLGAHLRLTRPRARLVHMPPVRVLNPAFAAAEATWILSGSDDAWIFTYNSRLKSYADDGVLRGAYGPRMRRWQGTVDQLARVVELLRSDRDSRRAVIQLYDPALDADGHSNVPCTLGYRFYIRDGRLHMATTMRSQDVWLGLPYDVFMATIVQELVATWVGAEVGAYDHYVDSLHLYENNLPQAIDIPMPTHTDEMGSLSVPWAELDDLLARVVRGAATGHPGWDVLSACMSSYRSWKIGDRNQATNEAARVSGPLGHALKDWYERLMADRRSDTVAVSPGGAPT